MTEREVLDRINACMMRLREAHFAQAHTDMVGDEEERRGYLNGIAALANAMKADLNGS
jgi:hypothetical protein